MTDYLFKVGHCYRVKMEYLDQAGPKSIPAFHFDGKTRRCLSSHWDTNTSVNSARFSGPIEEMGEEGVTRRPLFEYTLGNIHMFECVDLEQDLDGPDFSKITGMEV